MTTLLPFPIMFGIYYSVLYPLQNVLHIGKDVITKATDMMQTIPGVSSQFLSGQNAEMDIIKHFDALRGYLGDIFSASELDQIGFLSKGFHFLGLDLLQTPAGSDFWSFMWLIRFCAWSSAWFSQFIMTRSQPAMAGQKGCMKVVMYALPLMSAYFAYVMPAPLGFYWIISTLTSLLATLVVNKFYSHQQLTAKMGSAARGLAVPGRSGRERIAAAGAAPIGRKGDGGQSSDAEKHVQYEKNGQWQKSQRR